MPKAQLSAFRTPNQAFIGRPDALSSTPYIQPVHETGATSFGDLMNSGIEAVVFKPLIR